MDDLQYDNLGGIYLIM